MQLDVPRGFGARNGQGRGPGQCGWLGARNGQGRGPVWCGRLGAGTRKCLLDSYCHWVEEDARPFVRRWIIMKENV
jgi:hypothetical protein